MLERARSTSRRRHHWLPAWGALVTVVMTVGLGSTTFAKTDPVVACAAAKLKSVGGTASASLACHAQAAQKGNAVDPKCLEGAAAKLAAAFAKAEAAATKAGTACPEDGAAPEAAADVDVFVGNVVTSLRPQVIASKCVAKKLASVGKHAQKLLAAHAANLVKVDPGKFDEKMAKAEGALTSLFAKLDAKAKDCQTSGDPQGMVAAADSLAATQACDDVNQCTVDTIDGLVCQHTPITCSEHYACDFRTGSCAYTDCCLMSSGAGLCVVEIPVGQIPTSKAFCEGADMAQSNLSLLNFGPQCIGWRATGANDCP